MDGLEGREESMMTIRDQFAMSALQGLLSIYSLKADHDYATVVSRAFRLADLCMKEREKG